MNRYEFYGNINTYRKNQTNKENELTHYGTLGQKWGVRKWQNPDGTFNEAGKERYFGKIGSSNKTDKMIEKAKKKADKINAKIEKAVQSRLKHPLIYNTKGVNEDELRKFFTAYYNTPFYKRDARGIEKTFNNLYDSEINSKMINNIKDAENAQWMHRQAVQQRQQFVNQINLQNHLNIHNQMVMNHMNFMGKPNKKQKEEQKELNKEIKELTNNVETSFNIPDKFKEYKKEITDQVCEQIAYMIRSNPDGELPKKIDVNISDDGRLNIDFAYDNNDQKIDASYKMSYQNEEEAEGKIGSSWKSMTDDDYAKVEKDMKKAGWDTEENRKPGVQVYSKPIDNDDYKGIKYEVDAYKFHDNSVDDINKKYQEHINFLNKKDSLKQVLDNFADYEYPYYEKYINNHNKYFDNKLDVISKAEFINAVKSNINLNKTGLSWNDELYMQFVPKENKDFNYFKDMYDVFTVDVDPKSGKVSDFTIV